ncbi:MAG TPA: ferredoxin reductase [Acidimicrobiales bacterium]|nr:ferredoxin reductase [Acidimicrobiales bacterium]
MLTEATRRAVRVLHAASTPHGFDRYLELVAPTWSSHEVRGRITSADRRSAGTVTLSIEANRNWTGFEAGQYVQLGVEVDGVRHTRCYSLAHSAAGPSRRLELTVKAHPGGVVSNHLVERAAPGMIVGLSPAQGDFTLPPCRPAHILLISGGSGITPVMSMLRTLCDEGHTGAVTFVHYCPGPGHLSYGPELAALARAHPHVRLVRVYTDQPGTGDLDEEVDGFVTEAQLDAVDPAWRSAETFVCGPAALMAAVEQLYDDAGVGAHLHSEAFTLARLVVEADGAITGRVTFAASAVSVVSDGRPVLEQAEAAGLRPASGCRMGICHTCVCPLVSGAVRDVLTGAVTSTPGEQIRICVSAPLGDVEVAL